jgi:putative Ca2+/H+ antiporter (TMEM165/GDT1 family)
LEPLLVCAGIVALAETGDKTQLLTLLLAARYRRPWAILAGILVATVLNHALAAAVGTWVADTLSPSAMRWVLGLSFLAMAAWILVPDKLDGEGLGERCYGNVLITASQLFFLAEIGDKTQIATVSLAARYDSLSQVLLGTTLGMLAANAPVACCGNVFARHVPLSLVRAAAAVLFALLGVGVLVLDWQ